ncbi:MAG: hypothetical protein BJ554DRAFT_7047 [Olpidium bornovanus]|uniref:Uncharacterized protein n=1 Tax=Olpidium bornovanus TaxID=278681 RepID=A0A8H7ZWV8_9FUNG|nr:MAG: hypothetical protein BJ554DRAFT_7047 [Olpidium bornovanus]
MVGGQYRSPRGGNDGWRGASACGAGGRRESSSIGGLRRGLFYGSAPGFGGCPALDPAAASALRPPLALCPAPFARRPSPAARLPWRRSTGGLRAVLQHTPRTFRLRKVLSRRVVFQPLERRVVDAWSTCRLQTAQEGGAIGLGRSSFSTCQGRFELGQFYDLPRESQAVLRTYRGPCLGAVGRRREFYVLSRTSVAKVVGDAADKTLEAAVDWRLNWIIAVGRTKKNALFGGVGPDGDTPIQITRGTRQNGTPLCSKGNGGTPERDISEVLGEPVDRSTVGVRKTYSRGGRSWDGTYMGTYCSLGVPAEVYGFIKDSFGTGNHVDLAEGVTTDTRRPKMVIIAIAKVTGASSKSNRVLMQLWTKLSMSLSLYESGGSGAPTGGERSH